VFLHGWGLRGHTYAEGLRRLAEQPVRVIAPALPGFGGTPALDPGEQSFAGHARWLRDFLEAFDVHEPVVVVGHSFGGGVAIQFAHDHPAAVRGLVLVNSVGGSAWSRHGSLVRSMAQRPLWDWGVHLARDLLPLRQLTRVLPVLLAEALPAVLRDPRAFARAARIARTADLTPELEELARRRLPVVVVWGASDDVITEASTATLCEALGAAPLVTVPGGHGWLLVEPERFAEVMTNVLPMAQHGERRVVPWKRRPARTRASAGG
jgi:pimeloyl-ACP methyl ester carboxylesterase